MERQAPGLQRTRGWMRGTAQTGHLTAEQVRTNVAPAGRQSAWEPTAPGSQGTAGPSRQPGRLAGGDGRRETGPGAHTKPP